MPILAGLIMPADELALVCMGLFVAGIVQFQNTLACFDLPNCELDLLPSLL